MALTRAPHPLALSARANTVRQPHWCYSSPTSVSVATGARFSHRIRSGDHTIAAQSKDCRFSTSHPVIIDAGTRRVAAIGRPVTVNRNDCNSRDSAQAEAAPRRGCPLPTLSRQ